jgi:hypothetical protein
MALTDAGVAALRGCKTNSGGAQPREEQRRESKRDRNRGRAGISVDEVERGKVGGGKERWETDHGIRWAPTGHAANAGSGGWDQRSLRLFTIIFHTIMLELRTRWAYPIFTD